MLAALRLLTKCIFRKKFYFDIAIGVWEDQNFMKKRSWFVVLCFMLVGILLTPVIMYRLSVSESKTFSAEIQYRFFGKHFFEFSPRMYFENIIGSREIYLSDSTIDWVYVDRATYKKLWPEYPFDIWGMHYSIIGTFRVRKVLSGGYSVAELVDTVHIAGDPYIIK